MGAGRLPWRSQSGVYRYVERTFVVAMRSLHCSDAAHDESERAIRAVVSTAPRANPDDDRLRVITRHRSYSCDR